MTNWTTVLPNPGTVQLTTMRAALTTIEASIGEQGLWPQVASASTADIDTGSAAGQGLVEVTGTTTITSFGTTAPQGRRKLLLFSGVVTLTHSASLVLPGGASITTEAGTLALVVRTSAGWRVLDVSLPSLMTPASIDIPGAVRTYLTNNRVIIRETRTDGTHNGATTSGSWQQRGVTLTEVLDAGSLCTVSGATFDLFAGTYDVEMRQAFGNQIQGVRGRLYNVTDAAAVSASLSESATHGNPATYNTNWWVSSRFRMTIAATKTFRMEYFAASGVATGGLGFHDGITAGDEIYASLDILKVG